MSVTTPVFSAIVVMKSLQRLREKSLLILTFCAYQDEDTRRATQKPTPDMACNWPGASVRRPRRQQPLACQAPDANDSSMAQLRTHTVGHQWSLVTDGLRATPLPVCMGSKRKLIGRFDPVDRISLSLRDRMGYVIIAAVARVSEYFRCL